MASKLSMSQNGHLDQQRNSRWTSGTRMGFGNPKINQNISVNSENWSVASPIPFKQNGERESGFEFDYLGQMLRMNSGKLEKGEGKLNHNGRIGSETQNELSFFLKRSEEQEQRRARQRENYLNELQMQINEQKLRKSKEKEVLRELANYEDDSDLEPVRIRNASGNKFDQKSAGVNQITQSKWTNQRKRSTKPIVNFDDIPIAASGSNKYSVDLEKVNEDTPVPVKSEVPFLVKPNGPIGSSVPVPASRNQKTTARMEKKEEMAEVIYQANPDPTMETIEEEQDDGPVPVQNEPERMDQMESKSHSRRRSQQIQKSKTRPKHNFQEFETIKEEIMEEETEPMFISKENRARERDRRLNSYEAPAINREVFGAVEIELDKLRMQVTESNESFGNQLKEIKQQLMLSRNERSKADQDLTSLLRSRTRNQYQLKINPNASVPLVFT